MQKITLDLSFIIRYFLIQFIQYLSKMLRSIQQVKEDFSATGKSIAEWARENNFSPDLVYRVLKTNRVPRRGESHHIAVKLGIKEQRNMD